MRKRRALSLEAARAALETRNRLGKRPGQAVDAVDMAESLGIEVRFAAIGSMEGMYYSDTAPTILLPSERPAGRQQFSCAHEVGHHVLGHRSKLDALIVDEGASDLEDDEWLANMFAAFFLMPTSAVSSGFRTHGWDPARCQPFDVLRVAQWLGVGYSTLVTQAKATLRLLAPQRANDLLKLTPRNICASVLGLSISSDVTFADAAWSDRAVDLRTGGVLALPTDAAVEETVVKAMGATNGYSLYEAVRPGRGRILFSTGEAVFIRVSRAGYVGRGRFRFLPDPDFNPLNGDVA